MNSELVIADGFFFKSHVSILIGCNYVLKLLLHCTCCESLAVFMITCCYLVSICVSGSNLRTSKLLKIKHDILLKDSQYRQDGHVVLLSALNAFCVCF